MLPMTALIEAPEHLLIRERKDAIVDRLKLEIMDNQIGDVQPILCIVSLGNEEFFDPNVKEGYVYETIGENNSREALQRLLREKPELQENSHRLCSVYSRMETKFALRLASKHNRATNFSHDMTMWDKVMFITK